jgi:hypothetical protein
MPKLKDTKKVLPSRVIKCKKTNKTNFIGYGSWVKPEDVHVEEIGIANDNIKKGIVLDSFNAG